MTNFRCIHKCARYCNSNSVLSGLGCKFLSDSTASSEAGQNLANDSIKPIKMAYTSYESIKQAEGSKESPIIIMHGLLGSKANWNTMSKVIHSKTNRKVIAVDARNHGDSPHTEELSYNHIAEDIKALMNDLNMEKAILLGHSMGGRSVMLLSLKHPTLVDKLIVVDISPIGTSPSLSVMPKYFDAMRKVNLDPKVSLSTARKLADKQMSDLVKEPEVRQFFLTNLVETEDGRYRWRINLESLSRNFINIASFPKIGTSFDNPTLFIGGENSDFLRASDELETRKLFPNAQFEYVPGAGHNVHFDKPNEFAEIVRKFIK